MRKLLLLLATVTALALAPPAVAATKTVSITRTGFVPARVTVAAGDVVVWRNVDTRRHQVVSDRGLFASPMLARNQAWSFAFGSEGTFRYHDGLVPSERGVVTVRPAPAAVTLGSSAATVVFGQQTTLSGVVSSRRANETVVLFARPDGQLSFVEVARVLTTNGGVWAYSAKPALHTVYRARFRSAFSGDVMVQVRPKLRLSASRRYFYARVYGARSFAGRYIVLQRRSASGHWVGVARYRLGRRSGRIFPVPRRRGVTTYRVYMTARQAGPGYTASWSGTQTARRR